MKKALITGVTGQDGSYLARHLLNLGYQVHGIKRHSSNINTPRIDDLLKNNDNQFFLHHGDITDSGSITRILAKIQPDEIYNLAALSHVAVSFTQPELVHQINAIGPVKIFEAIYALGMQKQIKYYQASTSEMYGKVTETPQKETTPFYPRSPYGIAKLSAYWTTINYRERGMYACNGILFNHESPVRGETFITRKITRGIAALLHGHINCIQVGNLNAKRDWGHAADYVMAMHLMLQQDEPEDFVIATGKTTTVRDMITMAFAAAGKKIEWFRTFDKEYPEYGAIKVNGKFAQVVQINPKYYRPTEVDLLIGDATKAKEKLGWQPKYTLQQMIDEMVTNDIKLVSKYGYNG